MTRLTASAAAPCLVALVAAGCGGDGRAAGCGTDADVVAVNRAADGQRGYGEIAVTTPEGGLEVVTGDRVAISPSFAPDGRSIVFEDLQGGEPESAGPDSKALWVVGADGSRMRRLTDGPWDEHPAWSPDGDEIAYARRTATGGSDLALIPAGGGAPRSVLAGARSEVGSLVRQPTWSPDGRQIAFVRTEVQADGSRHHTVWAVDADGGGTPRALAVVPQARDLDWHPNGQWILVGTTEPAQYLLDHDSGDLQALATSASDAAWSPDGEGIYHLDDDHRLTRGRIVDDRLEHDCHVERIEVDGDLFYGLATAPRPGP